jgi:hypothetical protein
MQKSRVLRRRGSILGLLLGGGSAAASGLIGLVGLGCQWAWGAKGFVLSVLPEFSMVPSSISVDSEPASPSNEQVSTDEFVDLAGFSIGPNG